MVAQRSGRTSILRPVQEGPGSLEALRQLNRLRVLETLRQRGGASRADIVRETGLSRTTVSSLVAALLEEGLVVERSDRKQQAPSPNGGRPPTLLTLDPSAGGVVGIDFGHDDVRVALADISCTLLAETSLVLDVDHHAEEALSAAAGMALGLIDDVGLERERIIGVGVALSAPVRAASRSLAAASASARAASARARACSASPRLAAACAWAASPRASAASASRRAATRSPASCATSRRRRP